MGRFRRLSTTPPSNLVVTNTYDWKTGGVLSVQHELSATPGDDITIAYTFDNNGRTTRITDGRGYNWDKGYDAMGRNTTLTSPDPGSGAYTNTKTLDGNGNILKTVDFKGTAHYYQYDGLNRMTGHSRPSIAEALS